MNHKIGDEVVGADIGVPNWHVGAPTGMLNLYQGVISKVDEEKITIEMISGEVTLPYDHVFDNVASLLHYFEYILDSTLYVAKLSQMLPWKDIEKNGG
jgi:hypothetical protein